MPGNGHASSVTVLSQSSQKLSWGLVLLLLWLPPPASDFCTVTLCLGWGLGCWKVFFLSVAVPCSVFNLACAAVPQKGVTLHTLAPPQVEDCYCLLLSACQAGDGCRRDSVFSKFSHCLKLAHCCWSLGMRFSQYFSPSPHGMYLLQVLCCSAWTLP